LPWPLAVIDIEASSLDLKGYPIEVGLALWPAPDDPVFGWSALIRPVEDWTRHGHWSPASAKVHGIRGTDLLAYGKPVEQVAMALNEILGVGVAWCDGAAYDTHWARALFKAAGVKPLFALGDWHRLAATLGKTARSRALDWLEVTKAQHRARNDAEQLLLALAHAVSAKTGPVQNLKLRLAGMNRTNASEQ
jgi:hypothetical protein